MKKPITVAKAALLVWPCVAYAQFNAWDSLNPLSLGTSGVRLYGVNGAVAYQTDASLLGLTGLQRDGRRTSPAMGMAGASMGWSHNREGVSAAVVYTPSFATSFNLNGFRSLNHSLAATGAGRVGSKWALSGSVQATATDFGQMLFSPSPTARLAGTGATFDDLVSALTRNPATNPQLAALVGVAPVVGTPEAAYIFGSRLLSTGASASVGYMMSTRSSISVSLGAVRTQFLNDNKSANPLADQAGVQQARSSSGSGGISWTYSLTPRTSVGVSMATARSFSGQQDGYTAHFAFSATHKVTEHLFVGGSGGTGRYLPIRGITPSGNFTQLIYGGTVGYRLFSHTLVATVNRSAADVYGLGADATLSSSGGWSWNRPGTTVFLSASYGYAQMTGSRFKNSGSRTGSLSVGKALNSHTTASLSYTHVQYPTQLFVAGSFQGLSGIVASISWSPAERRPGAGIHP